MAAGFGMIPKTPNARTQWLSMPLRYPKVRLGLMAIR